VSVANPSGVDARRGIRLNLDLTRSVFIGDQPSDIEAARAAGIGDDRILLVGEDVDIDIDRPSLFSMRCEADALPLSELARVLDWRKRQ